MKKISAILFCVLVLVLVVSCGGSSPSDAAKGFLNAMINNDTDAMAKVATPETVELMSAFGSKIQEGAAEQGVTNVNAFSFTETIDGDTATVVIKDPNGADAGSIDLIKVDGKWMVSMSMDK
jgi:hypothetical protein